MADDFALEYDVFSMERSPHVYLMVRFVGNSPPNIKNRRPLNISLVIDRSGSMAGAKIEYTRQAAQFLVQNLTPLDYLSVVLYNDRVETLIEPTHVINKDAINQKIAKIRISATTNLSGGWLQGCAHVASNYSGDKLNRVILMSDGLANKGVTDPNKLINMVAKRYAQEDISTTTMGLGEDFNEDLMMGMANAGGGAFYFIESPEVAPSIFNEELQGLLNVVGQNLTVRFTPTNAVKDVKQLNAYPDFLDKHIRSYRLGDVYANEEKTLVLEITIPDMESLGEVEVASLQFDYDELTSDGGSQHHSYTVPVVINAPATLPMRNAEIMENVLLLKAANARKQAVKEADKGKYEEATEILKRAIADIDDAGLENDKIHEERSALQNQADQMENDPESYDNYSRKTMSTQAMYTLTSRHEETVVLRRREVMRELEKRGVATDDDGNIISSDDMKPPTPINRENIVPPTHVSFMGKTIELDSELIQIGRSSRNDIQITKKGISRFHAQIRRVGDDFVIEDLGSTNGTYLNGKPISGLTKLSVNDEIIISDEKLLFHDNNGAL